jgi:hypothetical protein
MALATENANKTTMAKSHPLMLVIQATVVEKNVSAKTGPKQHTAISGIKAASNRFPVPPSVLSFFIFSPFRLLR